MYGLRSFALGIALTAAIGVTASAQAPKDSTARRGRDRGGMMARGERGGERALKGITLNSDQQTRIKAIHEQYRPQFQALRKDARSENGQRTRPDSAQRAQARDLMQREQADVRAVLTSAQQSQFDKNVAEMKANAGKRRDGERGHGRRREAGAAQGR